MKLSILVTSENLTSIDESQCAIQEFDYSSSTFTEIGRTSSIFSPQEKRWDSLIQVTYSFGHKQILRFSILDMLNNPIIQTDVALGYLLKSKPYRLIFPDSEKALLITINQLKESDETFTFLLNAEKVDKKDIFGKSDPFFIIFKMTQQGWKEVYKSEVIKNTLNPTWKEFQLKSHEIGALCSDVAMKIEVWDWDRNKTNDFIGATSLNLIQLFTANAEFELINKKKQKKEHYKNSGVLRVYKALIERKFSIVDFFQSGNRIDFIVGIDFSQSNGLFYNKSSLHYINSGSETIYERVIKEFGSLIEVYAKDQWAQMFAFGASTFDSRQVNDFTVLFEQRPGNDSVLSFDGLLQTYKSTVCLIEPAQTVKLYGLVQYIINKVTMTPNGQIYSVCLFLICGTVKDMCMIKELLLGIGNLPVNFIFIEMGKFMQNNPEEFFIHSVENIQFYRLKDFHCDIREICGTAFNKIQRHIENLQ